MSITIRPETPADYAAIAQVNARAFAEAGEAALVDALRHRQAFDPQLSLVAVAQGQVVGHALFVPATLRLAGQPVSAAILSPLAVHPDYQKQGIGGRLLAKGHARAKEKGCALALLLGHDTYYPRFGYRTHMFGQAAVRVAVGPEAPVESLPARAPTAADVPALAALWRRWFDDVDLSWAPDEALLAWLSADRTMCCQVLAREGEAVAYLRYRAAQPRRPACVLARDASALAAALALLGALPGEDDAGAVIVPVHPDAAATRELLPGGEPVVEAWSAGMILPLDESYAAVAAYVAEVAAARRRPGLVIWPTEYDLA